MDFENWLYNLKDKGLGFATQRYYGIYRGVVTSNQDPDKRGRIQVHCPQVGQASAPDKWIMPAFAGSGNRRGMFFAPEVDDTVWVSFYEGDPAKPEVYWGGWFGVPTPGTTDVPDALAQKTDFPEKKGFVTRAGHMLVFNDEAGNESVTIMWNKPADGDPAVTDRKQTAKQNPKKCSVFAFDKNGSMLLKTPSSYMFQIDDDKKTVTLTTPNGSLLSFDPDDVVSLMHKSGAYMSMGDNSIDITANTSKAQNVNVSAQNVNLNAGGVNIGGKAIDFAVLGTKLILWLATHIHSTALGPSTPPIVPPTPADFLSKTVKVQP